MEITNDTVWYVVASKANKPGSTKNYPLQIYADREIAEAVASANGEIVIHVKPLK